jgi:hypothetical protein
MVRQIGLRRVALFPGKRGEIMLRGCTVIGMLAAFPMVSLATILPTVSSGTRALQLDADTNVATGSGNAVQTWADASGNGIVFTAAGPQDVTLVANAFNGQAVLRFGGGQSINSYLQATAGNLSMLNNQPVTIFAVTRNTSNVNGLIDSHPGDGTALRTAFEVVQVADGNGQANVSAALTGSVTAIRYSLGQDPAHPGNPPVRHFETFIDSSSGSSAVDSVYGPAGATSLSETWLSNSVVNGSPFATVIGTINHGEQGLESVGRFNGDLAELVIYQGALSDSDRVAVENALFTAYAAPEPATGILLLLPLAGLLTRRRRA